MLENAAIDVAIGLVLMYLMLSLLCTVVNEYIATKLSLRANSLEAAIKKLLDDDTLRTAFYNHGLIVGTKRTVATGAQSVAEAATDAAVATARGTVAAAQGIMRLVGHAAAAVAPAVPQAAPVQPAPAPVQPAPVPVQPAPAPVQPPAAGAQPGQNTAADHPSYLSANTVALALIGSLDTPDVPNMGNIRDAVQALPDSKIRDVLLSCLTGVGDDFAKLQNNIATSFDDVMDRLSGAYKRQIQWISMLVGLTIAIAFNADSFRVATTLWKDPDSRAAAVEMARKVAAKPLPPADQKIDDAELKKQIDTTETTLRSLPIGWTCPAASQPSDSTIPQPKSQDTTWQDSAKQYWECAHKQKISVLQILGWLLTAAALSLGAPFWFDLLNQFINLRGAGTKPQRADAGS